MFLFTHTQTSVHMSIYICVWIRIQTGCVYTLTKGFHKSPYSRNLNSAPATFKPEPQTPSPAPKSRSPGPLLNLSPLCARCKNFSCRFTEEGALAIFDAADLQLFRKGVGLGFRVIGFAWERETGLGVLVVLLTLKPPRQ